MNWGRFDARGTQKNPMTWGKAPNCKGLGWELAGMPGEFCSPGVLPIYSLWKWDLSKHSGQNHGQSGAEKGAQVWSRITSNQKTRWWPSVAILSSFVWDVLGLNGLTVWWTPCPAPSWTLGSVMISKRGWNCRRRPASPRTTIVSVIIIHFPCALAFHRP